VQQHEDGTPQAWAKAEERWVPSGNRAEQFFSETLEDAGENGPSAREQCRINGWLNYDTTSGCTVAARNPGGTHRHHSDPKFMGGNPNQKLTEMPADQHRQLHRDLNDHLVRQTDDFGNHMRPQRGNPGQRIQDNFTPDQRRDAMSDFYRQNQHKYPDAAKDFFNQHPSRR